VGFGPLYNCKIKIKHKVSLNVIMFEQNVKFGIKIMIMSRAIYLDGNCSVRD